MSNYSLLTITSDNGIYTITEAVKNDGKSVEFALPTGSAIADKATFCKGIASAYNFIMVQRYFDLAIAPLANTEALDNDEKELLATYKAVYEALKTEYKFDAFYNLLARVWFNLNMRNVELSDKATNAVNILLKVRDDDGYTFSKTDCKNINTYLNDLIKPYIKEYPEVKNFTAKLDAGDLKRLAKTATAETFQGTKSKGVKVKTLKKPEIWRQFMLYALAKSFSLWEEPKASKPKSVEIIG